jgi:hypothetical protein
MTTWRRAVGERIAARYARLKALPMKINIETIPHALHRYPTLGDYWRDADGVLQIRVSETADPRDALLIAVHELIEVILCEDRGITHEAIDAWDKSHLDSDEPGELPGASYHHEHVFAENIERLLAAELGRNWQEYYEALAAL